MANTILASLLSSDISLQLLDSIVSISIFETVVSTSEWSNIAIIGITAFLHASKLPGFNKFQLCLCFLNIQANFVAKSPVLFNVSFEYYKFADIFSKTKVEVLAPHYSYDLQINLEEGVQPPVSPTYSSLTSEQKTLKGFIEENLNTGFIWPTSSLHNYYDLKLELRLHLGKDLREDKGG